MLLAGRSSSFFAPSPETVLGAVWGATLFVAAVLAAGSYCARRKAAEPLAPLLAELEALQGRVRRALRTIRWLPLAGAVPGPRTTLLAP